MPALGVKVSGAAVARHTWPGVACCVSRWRVAGLPRRQAPSREHALQPTRHSSWAPFQYLTVPQPAETLGFFTFFIRRNRTRCDVSEMLKGAECPACDGVTD